MKIIYLFVLTCNVLNIMLSDAAAQDRWPNLPAEGPVARRDSQYGVNRRVAIGRPEDAQVIGYFQIEATFDCKFAIPSSGNITAPGDLPNKPTFYFGIRGPVRIQRNGQTVTENREVDAGLEWDSRANHRGWRAFISVNGVQTNYNINGVRWRGLAQQYFLRLRIDDNGIPWMRVQGGGANFSFPWSSDNQPHGSGEAVFPGTARELLGLKRVIADTRPEPSSGNERDNYRLDGTRINCMTSNNRIYYSP